jgi:hypothetical protein
VAANIESAIVVNADVYLIAFSSTGTIPRFRFRPTAVRVKTHYTLRGLLRGDSFSSQGALRRWDRITRIVARREAAAQSGRLCDPTSRSG